MVEQWTNRNTGNTIEATIYEDTLISTLEELDDRYSQVIFRVNGGYLGLVGYRKNEKSTALLVLESSVFRCYNDVQKDLEILHESRTHPSWTADLTIGVKVFERGLNGGGVHV